MDRRAGKNGKEIFGLAGFFRNFIGFNFGSGLLFLLTNCVVQKMAEICQHIVGGFFGFNETFFNRRKRRNKPSNTIIMKKTIMLAAVLGFSAAFNASAAEAKDNWSALCAKCHGDDGKGATKMGTKLGCKDYTDAKVQADLKDDAMTKAVKEGLKSDDGRTLMKPYDTLSDDEVKALVAYIRSFKS